MTTEACSWNKSFSYILVLLTIKAKKTAGIVHSNEYQAPVMQQNMLRTIEKVK